MARLIKLLDEWLPLLAGLSGVVVPVYDPYPDDEPPPDLDQQLKELLEFVARQERSWQPASRNR